MQKRARERAGLRVTLTDARTGLVSICGTGERFRDRQGRERPRVHYERGVLLVAYGVDPVGGERWLNDWERAARKIRPVGRRRLERLH